MVYKWDAHHREECYELYVNQKKTISQIADFFQAKYNFCPNRRTFQHKFKEWQFPHRSYPKYQDEELVSRVKELWSQNLTVPEMHRILTEEDGYDLSARGLQRIRSDNGLMLRTSGLAFGLPTAAKRVQKLKASKGDSSGSGNGATGERQTSHDTAETESDEESDEEMEDEEEEDDESQQQEERWADIVPAVKAAPGIPDLDLNPEELAATEMRKQQRLMELQAESMARWATKKRRRRTMPYAGLPADPPNCPPRFPSETTLSETKVILGLDEEAYMTVRAAFRTLCEQAGVIKKTIAGPEKWEALKDQLVRESIHLRSSMWDQTDVERKKLAIDVICCDVTKAMRVKGTKLSVAGAKTILNLDPEQGRQIRSSLYLILAKEKFETKKFEGKAYWQEIKAKWYETSDLMRRLSQFERPDCPDPDRQQKLRALEYLARDATRRYREEITKKGRNLEEVAKPPEKPAKAKAVPPNRSRATPKGKEPTNPKKRGRPTGKGKNQRGEAHTEARLAPIEIIEENMGPQPVDPLLDMPTRPLRFRPPQGLRQQSEFDAQFETSFSGPSTDVLSGLQQPMAPQPATSTPPAPTPAYRPPQRRQRNQAVPVQPQPQPQDRHIQPPPQPQQPPAPASMAVFYKLHSNSALPTHMTGPSMWISTVSQHPTVEEVRTAALAKYPGAMCFAIEGIVKDGKGGELPLPVSDDMELEAYLQHVQGNTNVTGHSAAPTFVVQLMA